jgi:hypothetical protein
MMEAHIERGSWHYRVVSENGVALRSRCSFSDATKIGKGPLKGAVIEVTQRVQVGSTTFLQMKANIERGEQEEGRWIFDSKAGRKVLEGPMAIEVPMLGTKAVVKPATGVHLRSGPTKMDWAETKMRLLKGAKVDVLKLTEPLPAEQHTGPLRYAYVTKSGGAGGIEGWMYLDDLILEEQASPGETNSAEGMWGKQSSHTTSSSGGKPICPKDKSLPSAATSSLRNAGTTPAQSGVSELLREAPGEGYNPCSTSVASVRQRGTRQDVVTQVSEFKGSDKTTNFVRPVAITAWSTPILSN